MREQKGRESQGSEGQHEAEGQSRLYPRIVKCLAVLDDLSLKWKKYLDVGCGTGTYTRLVAKRIQAQETHGVDTDEAKLSLASLRGVVTHKLDVSTERLPFRDESFNLVTAFEVIEHLVNPDHLLREVNRVLAPSGHFLLTTPNLGSWLNRGQLLLGFQPTYLDVSTEISPGHFAPNQSPLGHLRLFTLRALQELLSHYRFEILRSVGSESLFQPRLIRFLDGLIARIPSMARILVVLSMKSERIDF